MNISDKPKQEKSKDSVSPTSITLQDLKSNRASKIQYLVYVTVWNSLYNFYQSACNQHTREKWHFNL